MIKYHTEFEQGSADWVQARCGLLTASEMKLVVTPTLKIADNEKTRTHLYELLAQRISNYVEPHYVSDDMLRGGEEEIEARIAYEKHYSQVQDVGFITNNDLGFTLGYSPDGLVGDDGLIEAKSRRQKYQIQTIVENIPTDTVPDEYMLQIQTGLFVSGRAWCDFISYSNGLHMATIRVYPNAKIRAGIIEAAKDFENKLQEKLNQYKFIIASKARLIPTERKVYQEVLV